jgi:hypothetical protein
MPGPPDVGYELLHDRLGHEIMDLYGIPFDDERAFVDAYLDREPDTGIRKTVSSAARTLLRGSESRFTGFKTFAQFHRYCEFFERSDITFIVLHRRNLDVLFLSWCVATYRQNFEDTFDKKLADFRFADVADRTDGLRRMMRDLLFNLRVMSDLLERGAIELVVDEDEQVANNPRLDAFFERPIDFSTIQHRSDYSVLPDMDLFQKTFRELLDFWRSRSCHPSRLLREFESRRPEYAAT